VCGRYATTRSDADLTLLFDAAPVAEPSTPSWNVAPTDPVPVARISQRHEGRVLDSARWGLSPSWWSGAPMINARAETVATSPAFAPSFARRRCLVPADGWFEWVREGKRKQPFYMTPADGTPLVFAGLWAVSGTGVLTCGIVTAEAVGELAGVHSRMPLVLPAERWPDWLAGDADPPSLLRPMTAAELSFIEIRPVGPAVGNVRNNGPELIALSAQEPTLF
jgi:putative SOS response-associated peptidase YedK